MSRATSPLSLITGRRSTGALIEPGPSRADLEAMLAAAVTVPDHACLRPWRLVVVEGEGPHRSGRALAAAGLEADPALADVDALNHQDT